VQCWPWWSAAAVRVAAVWRSLLDRALNDVCNRVTVRGVTMWPRQLMTAHFLDTCCQSGVVMTALRQAYPMDNGTETSNERYRFGVYTASSSRGYFSGDISSPESAVYLVLNSGQINNWLARNPLLLAPRGVLSGGSQKVLHVAVSCVSRRSSIYYKFIVLLL